MRLLVIAVVALLLPFGRGDPEHHLMKTPNFIIDASSGELAKSVGVEAEKLRRQIAVEWLGRELPKWDTPCLLFVTEGDREDDWGWTYHFRGQIRGIAITGSRQNIFTHTLPHEIGHTVILTHFDFPLPRWFDEGVAVSCEKDCPRRLGGRCGQQPLADLFDTQTYPEDWGPFYGQSYSVTDYLVKTYGKPRVFEFVRQGRIVGWEKSSQNILHKKLAELDNDWRHWYIAQLEKKF